ncbi:SAUR-like auxin-responsive protein family [Artemisia annua]|uniref:SAUR-like auxin-responsive protein family n=1 Tax=Artemisia annua TaxID=35608 RepID=A0A2U1KRW0_ARTAN|nr:SAUR-like auxin-responsive protein family [Artemisia annua]
MMKALKLVRMARKWHKEASNSCNERMADKGHFVVYTTDHNRFVIPLRYLNTNIFRELLRMSEDEFGLPTDGPITLLCDSTLMSYLISMFDRDLLYYYYLRDYQNIKSPSFCGSLNEIVLHDFEDVEGKSKSCDDDLVMDSKRTHVLQNTESDYDAAKVKEVDAIVTTH